MNDKDVFHGDENADASIERWELKLLNFSAFNAKCSSCVSMRERQRACMRLIHITFYKNVNDKMFNSVASENGAVWMNPRLFPLNWRLFANILVTSVNPAYT